MPADEFALLRNVFGVEESAAEAPTCDCELPPCPGDVKFEFTIPDPQPAEISIADLYRMYGPANFPPRRLPIEGCDCRDCIEARVEGAESQNPFEARPMMFQAYPGRCELDLVIVANVLYAVTRDGKRTAIGTFGEVEIGRRGAVTIHDCRLNRIEAMHALCR